MWIRRERRATALLVAATALGVVACEQSTSTAPSSLHAGHATAAISTTGAEHAGLVTAVRAATARFNSTTLAAKAGYVEEDICVAAPGLGGMGYHWPNPSLVDGVFEPTKPEVMLYAPDKQGRLKLVAVEYLVVNTGQTRPTFNGQAFDVGGAPLPVPHWTLHVWLYETNASGLFAPFNPGVACP